MRTLARWCVQRRAFVLIAWLVTLLAVTGFARATGSRYSDTFNLPHSDSMQALSMLETNFPSHSGDVDQIVFQAKQGNTLLSGPVQAQVMSLLHEVETLPGIKAVVPPYGAMSATQMSKDHTIGFANVIFGQEANSIPASQISTLISTTEKGESPQLQVALGGRAIENAVTGTSGGTQSSSVIISVVFTALVLFLAFGSLFSMLMPLLTALMAIGLSLQLIQLLTHVYGVASFAPILAILIGLGVGVDYALFIISRHRTALRAGRSPEEAIVLAVNTSGRAVLFAGATVAIALLGQFVLRLNFLYGVAVAATITVALTVLASLTLMPAMLGYIGMKALSRRERARLHTEGPHPEEVSGFWLSWSGWIDKRAILMGILGLGMVVVLALPTLGLSLGLSDSGNDPTSMTTRQAYDLLAKGFGPGFNGPFEIAVALPNPAAADELPALRTTFLKQSGIAAVDSPIVSPNGKVAVMNVYPSTSPQATATTALLKHLRSEVIPKATAGTDLVVRVGGSTAIGADFSHVLASKLPLFIAVVVLVSCLLLMVVFRSIVIPLTASFMNLLSVGAAFGILQAVFERGIGNQLIGVGTGPVDVFVPVLLFSVLFGLSMDYEVFLVSRMHEEWSTCHDNRQAVARGQAETGRVITAAASIMVLVFISFIFGGSRIIKEFGLGFACAVFIDAFVIRTIIVPSVMHLFGKANWWLPSWLSRLLPAVAIEGPAVQLESVVVDPLPAEPNVA